MTEKTETNTDNNSERILLSELGNQFVLHWGEMGSRWGINRTVSQIHALLYYTGKPANAEQIADVLQIARSNVSNSLNELIENNTFNNNEIEAKKRVKEMLSLMQTLSIWGDEMLKLKPETLTKIMKYGAKIKSLLG